MWTDLAAAAAAVSGVMYYATGVPSSQLFGPSLARAPRNGDGPRLALTFDDGPSESTPEILEVLAEHRARATFFLLGANAERLPEVARSVARQGHETGSHSYSHPRFYLSTPRRIAAEIARGQQALEGVLGTSPSLFRPPYGIRWFGMFPAVEQHGLTVVMWSVCGYDWKRSGDWIARHVVRHAGDGDVVLLHDGKTTMPGNHRRETARALRAILPVLAERGFQAVTVGELFGLR